MRKLADSDIKDAAVALGVDTAAVRAVTEVEAPGGGYYDDGRPKILFERHVMYRLYKTKFGQAAVDKAAFMYPEICNPKPGGYGPSLDQPIRMESAAKLLDRDCALQAASWGMFQIMGYYWKDLGYISLQAFVNAMYASEGAQLQAFVAFIEENPTLHRALKELAWSTFAQGYNGPDYAKNKYDTKLATAYKKFQGA